MEFTSFGQAQVKIPLERWDGKACWEVTDRHFECLSQYRKTDPIINHYRCPGSYESWQRTCDPAVRRVQVEEFERRIKDSRLYNEAQLKDINAKGNIKSYPTHNPFKQSSGMRSACLNRPYCRNVVLKSS
eukprot:TRINITY_DN3049_c0_g1_i2.p2 TRINITY_DN3049_c0_g1~~TRINITY_DN3049_c0_g1_i2.p2  ORF type:complete len:130 (-),score=17.68 TRINITY_DN3049_c0_g1_i2:293-682(-)